MKVQVLAVEGKYDCRFIEQLYEQAQQNYSGMELNPIDIVFGSTVINLDADLLISPIDTLCVRVGFKSKLLKLQYPPKREVVNWITITDRLGEELNALSNFLLLIFGTTALPSGVGFFNTDFEDAKAVMLHGKNGVLTSLNEIKLNGPDETASCLIWSSYEGKFMVAFNRVCTTISRSLRNQGLLAIMNLTDYPILNKNNIVLLVKK